MRQPGGGPDGEAFWRFSLALYARPGAAAALLRLQDRAGLDVNLLLFALWCGASRAVRLDAERLAAATAASVAIKEAVEPLRGLRRRLKGAELGDGDRLRQRVAVLEVAAEREAQRCLAAAAAGWSALPEPDRFAAASANLSLCLGAEDASAEAALLREAATALMRVSSAFPVRPTA